MKICFVADGRSPIARSWIGLIRQAGHEVHLVSTFPYDEASVGASSTLTLPVGFAALSSREGASSSAHESPRPTRTVQSLLRGMRGGAIANGVKSLRNVIGPLDVIRRAPQLRRHVETLRPDIVHALRIPFEGFLAATAMRGVQIPLVVSVWGNDFTLHAPKNALMGRMTRRTMLRADALHPDCQRDLVLAANWGFDAGKPAAVLPGSGGIDSDVFRRGPRNMSLLSQLGVTADAPVIINPRGIRDYVRNDVFFASIPRVLAKQPRAVFLCLAMKGNEVAERWVRQYGVGASVRLLPPSSKEVVADLFRLSDISVSPSVHDGTPNTMLEAMACGAMPVVGDIPSVAEWIEHERNGLLCSPHDPEALAAALLTAIESKGFRTRAADFNSELVDSRASRRRVMSSAVQLYEAAISRVQSEA